MTSTTISPSVWLRAIRAPSLTATFAPCAATALLGYVSGWTIDPGLALFSVLGVLAVQIGVNLMNDVEDDQRGIDVPGTLGGSGVLQARLVSPATLRRAAWGAFAVGFALGLPALIAEPGLLALVAIAALGAWGYSGGPGLKYRGLGDLAVVALCGPVLTAGFALAAFGHVASSVLGLGIAFGFAALGILHVNNFQDMRVDAAHGAKTVALALGTGGSRAYLVIMYAIALGAWPVGAALASLPWPAVVIPLAAAIPIGSLLRRLLGATTAADASGLQAPTLALVRIEAAKVHLALGALISLGLIVSLI